jgi:hypothetical protein
MSEEKERKEIADTLNDALNAKKVTGVYKKSQHITTGRTNNSLGKFEKYVIRDFSGKKLKHDKASYISPVRQHFVEKGTRWEDITPDIRTKINFTKKDFE